MIIRETNQTLSIWSKMFRLNKWGDREYKTKLLEEELVKKDEGLIQKAIRRIKQEKGPG